MSDKMTIAQALRRIKKLKGLIAENEQRAKAGVSYDVTKVPAFRFRESLDKMFALQDEMVALEARVAIANATATVQDGDRVVSMALAVRSIQELKGRIALLKGLHLRNETVKDRQTEWDDNESKHITRVSETVYMSDLTEQDRDSQIKSLQDHFEVLNNAIENVNHEVMV
jgi:uncharacterized small protein (DUF1192 family)